MPDPLNNLKRSLDQLLQADTSIKRKNKKIYDQKKELFINLINSNGFKAWIVGEITKNQNNENVEFLGLKN